MKDLNALYKKFMENNPHVIKYRNKKVQIFLLKCLSVWAVIISVMIIGRSRTYLILFGIPAGVCLTVWIFIRSELISGKWTGVIVNATVETKRVKTEGKIVAPGMYTSMRDQNYIDFFIKTDNGKNKHFEMPEQYVKVYRVGDRVLSVPGIKYKINLTNKEMTLCPKCGSIFPSANERCVTIGCRMPTVNIYDPFREFDKSDQDV